jgi:uncharacterized protein
MAKTFLEAEWRKLAMANFAVDPQVLKPFVPHKTELDLWNNTCYLSLVGFMFLQTKVKGFKVPFHVNFEEVNLRFYVKYKDGVEWKRGVVFIKEIVPRSAITLLANTLYNENYQTLPMSHKWETIDNALSIEYCWKKHKWHSFKVVTERECHDMQSGSEEEFITEHFWGYTKSGQKTAEYGVEHPRWQVYKMLDFKIDVDFGLTYGKQFEFINSEKPLSVFLAEGSEIRVMGGRYV